MDASTHELCQAIQNFSAPKAAVPLLNGKTRRNFSTFDVIVHSGLAVT
jgi:hypothetical protein